MELSTAPEAFELNTKYYHPTEAGSQTESFELSMLFPNCFLSHSAEESVMQWLPGLNFW